jgi:hypothetical protein
MTIIKLLFSYLIHELFYLLLLKLTYIQVKVLFLFNMQNKMNFGNKMKRKFNIICEKK